MLTDRMMSGCALKGYLTARFCCTIGLNRILNKHLYA